MSRFADLPPWHWANGRAYWLVWGLALYAIIGLGLGFGLKHQIPAVNALGVTYYAATWPLQILRIAPLPGAWAFTFEDRP